MNCSYWKKHPHLIPLRINSWIWERRNPEKPWLCPGTVTFLETHLDNSMAGLEFGSGRSTIWLAHRMQSLVSVEHDPKWHAWVKQRLDEEGIEHVDYRLVEIESFDKTATVDEHPYFMIADEFEDESLDIVIVDGKFRIECINRSLNKIKPSGIILVDDVNIWPNIREVPIPEFWPILDLSSNGIKKGCIWQRPI